MGRFKSQLMIVGAVLAMASSAFGAEAELATATNLIPDSGFENGVSGFKASPGDQAVRTTSNPISGAASLSVSLKTVGSEVFWSQAVAAGTSASALSVAAKLRPDTISQWTTLQLCAEAVYANELGTLQKCVPVSTVPGAVNTLSVEMPLDPSKIVATVTVQVILRSATAVAFALDDVSAALTAASVNTL